MRTWLFVLVAVASMVAASVPAIAKARSPLKVKTFQTQPISIAT